MIVLGFNIQLFVNKRCTSCGRIKLARLTIYTLSALIYFNCVKSVERDSVRVCNPSVILTYKPIDEPR